MRRIALPEAAYAGELPGAVAAGQRVQLVAPASRVLLTKTELPPRSRRRLRQLLPFALEEKLAVEPAQVHAALGAALPGGAHPVAVVDRGWLAGWLGALAAAGVHLASMRVETLLVPFVPGTWAVVWRGDGGFVRTGPTSGAAVDGDSTQLALMLAEARASNAAPEKLVVHAPADAAPDLAAWSEALDVACELAEPWALDAAPDDPHIELLQGDFAQRGATGEIAARLRPALVLLAAAALVELGATGVHWAMLKSEKAALQREMHALFRRSFPQARAIVDPALQMRRLVEEERSAAGEARPGDFLVLAARAAQLIDRPVRRIEYAASGLVVDVELARRADADALLRRLKAEGIAAELAATDAKGATARLVLPAKGGA